MPFHIRITAEAVYHNGAFVKHNPPQTPEYAELIAAIESNAAPRMETEPAPLTREMLEKWGMKLFLALFGPDRAAPDEPILLEIVNPVTRLIPFEILHDGEHFLARTIGVARIYDAHKSCQWEPLTDRMAMLAAFAGPLMHPHLDDPEHPNQPDPIPVRHAAETFRDALLHADIPADLTIRRHLTPSDLQTELKKAYQVFHFMGHGNYNGVLLEDEHGLAVRVKPDWLKRLLRRLDLRLAVLNSCDTAKTKIEENHDDLALNPRFVDLFHDLNTPFTIAMQFSIQQNAGNAYMQAFYRSLLAGAAFLEAVQEACEHIASEPHGFPFWQFLIPVAHVHPDMVEPADERRLFTSTARRGVALNQPDLPLEFSYARNERFTGRAQELVTALKALDPRHGQKALMLHGQGGMGKTALAIELAYRAARWYPHVWWTSGRKNAPDGSLAGTLEDRETLKPVESDAELFINLAAEIGVATDAHQSIEALIRSIHATLKNGPPALLILDNLEHFREIGHLHHLLRGLPANCKAILTSRVDIPEEKYISEQIAVRSMTTRDAFRLIHTIAEDLQLEAWWEHYAKINAVAKGHAQTIHILTRQLDNSDPQKRQFFQWIEQFQKLSEEGEALFLYVFERKLDDIRREEEVILFALSLFDEPASSPAIHFICQHEIPSSKKFQNLLKQLAKHRFIESFEDDAYSLQALTDYIVRQRFKRQKATAITLRQNLIRYWHEQDEPLAEAEAYYRLADLQDDYDDWYDALASLESSEQIWQSLDVEGETPTQILNIAKSFSLKGTLLRETGQWAKATEFSEKALDIKTALGDRRGMANAYGNLGIIYEEQCQWAKATEFYDKALDIKTTLEDRQGIASCMGNLGNIYREQGQWSKATEFYEKALEIQTALGDRQGMASVMGNLGIVYRQQGQWAKATEFYDKALDIKTTLEDRQGIASCMGNLGNIYREQGQWSKATEFYDKALEIDTALEDQQGMASSIENLGIVYAEQGQWAKATGFYEKALEIQTALGDRQGMANQLGNLGSVYLQQGKRAKATEFYEKALEIQTALGDRQGMASVMGNLGNVYRLQGDIAKGIEFHKQSLNIEKQLGNPFGVMQSLLSLAQAFLQTGQAEKALSCLDEAEPLAKRFDQKQYLEMIEHLRRAAL